MDLALSIDIGGSKIAVGLVTRNGELIDRTQFVVNAQDSSEELFDDLSRAVDAQLLRVLVWLQGNLLCTKAFDQLYSLRLKLCAHRRIHVDITASNTIARLLC